MIPTGAEWHGKAPLVSTKKYLTKRPPTEQEIEYWLSEFGPLGWGLVRGAFGAGITLDQDGTEDDTAGELFEKLGLPFHRRTPRDGYHRDTGSV